MSAFALFATLEKGMYRNRRLLNLAHSFPFCTNCERSTPEGCDPAHSNLSEHGKGKALKAHDCFVAFLCSSCHRWLDGQGGHGKDPSGRFEATAEDKREMFIRAMHRTWLELWKRLLVKVP